MLPQTRRHLALCAMLGVRDVIACVNKIDLVDYDEARFHEIADELNLHAVDLADAASGVVDRTLKPNFRALGPAFGSDAPAVAAALSALDVAGAEELLAAAGGGDLALIVDGRTLTITAEMFEIVEQPRTGWSVVSDGSHAVALDTTLTPELELEGAARELVRGANEQRKAVGLDLADRIHLDLMFEVVGLGDRLAAAGAAQPACLPAFQASDHTLNQITLKQILFTTMPLHHPNRHALLPLSWGGGVAAGNKQSCFPAGCADSAAEDGRRGSNVYEVNTWLWQFGRGKPRLGGLTIEETSDRQDAARKASDKCRKETREGRKGDGS
jgi:hypothetical protein